jgi:hypothetical protein
VLTPSDESVRSGGASVRDAVAGASGYTAELRLAPGELATMRGFIEEQWLARITEVAPEHAAAFRDRGMERYHELSHLLDHATIWPKAARILPATVVAAFRRTSLASALEEAFGPFEISDEEEIGHEEIYWRLVRPNQAGDAGPMHADRWFWDLGHGRTPAGRERVKVWVSVANEPGLSGLALLPGSHLREWRYHGELKHGFVKPVIDEEVERLPFEVVPTRPGDAVVFNDRLLHGGRVGAGRFTRVSFELTMFVEARSDGAADRGSVEA